MRLSVAIIFLSTLDFVILINNKFPDDFLFGVATSAYQIEGGHESRGETIFDRHLRLNPSITSNAQTTCNSYHLYHEDLKLVKELGVQFYRFSISWSRILPTGYINNINLEAIQYYNNVIDGLISNGIKPMVTMFHYDMPQVLQDLGGWANPLVTDFFEDYAGVLFKNFGDRVPYWVTLNVNYCGFGDDIWPPRINQSGIGEYLAAKNIILAHAKSYRLYEKQFKHYKGQFGLTTDGQWFEAASKQDEGVAERAREFQLGLMMNPIYGDGDFPQVVKDRVKDLSLEEGFVKSRLPEFSQQEKEFVKGTFDFLGLNMYTTMLVREAQKSGSYSMRGDIGGEYFQDPKWEGGKSPWLKVVPWGFRRSLNWIKGKYGNPPIIITENGFSDSGQLNDLDRIKYYEVYLKALLQAIYDDGVDVKGYSVWSLMDNFEWLAGYSEKFGLYHVDFNDPERKRTPKASAHWYKQLIRSRRLDDGSSKTEL